VFDGRKWIEANMILGNTLHHGLKAARRKWRATLTHKYRVLIWAAVCTIGALWFYRQSFTVAFSDADYSTAVKLVNAIAIVLVIGLCFLASDSAIYFLVRSISN
jgi:hypothetical protein